MKTYLQHAQAIVFFGCFISIGLAPYPNACAQEGNEQVTEVRLPSNRSDEEILAGANERIERYRKGSVTIALLDRDGNPLPAGTVLRISQTRHAFLFGGNSRLLLAFGGGKAISRLTPEQARMFRDRFADLFNYCILPAFWQHYETVPGKPVYEVTQRGLEWAEQHGMKTKVTPLAWTWIPEPPWVRDMTPDKARAAQIQRVRDFASHFKGRVDGYEVLNEPSGWFRDKCRGRTLMEAARPDGIGEFARVLYREARAADPSAKPHVNDFKTDGTFERDGIDPLILDDGTALFDVIGLQSHMYWMPTWPMEKLWNMCEQFKKYDKPILC